GFVKKPRQHYGVVYVFCLTSSQNSPDQETRFIQFASLIGLPHIKSKNTRFAHTASPLQIISVVQGEAARAKRAS
ncbi:MAG: hypothetical protein ACI974_001531, partial [Paraglaciecola sp.]